MAKDIFVPILKKLDGLKGVKFTGGVTEQGIDVEYYELAQPDKKRKYAGIQFKKGDLKYGAGGNKNTVKEVKNQAEEAFDKDIHAIDNDSYHRLSRFVCAVTGEINEPARAMIAKAKVEKGGQIDFWDGQYLCQLIRDHWLDEFIAYFELDDEEIAEAEEEESTVVDAAYIEENYPKRVQRARAVKRTISNLNWRILRAALKVSRFGKSGITLADVLLELERSEEYISEELDQLRRLGYLEFDNDGSLYLSGNATALEELGAKIVEEIVDAGEEDTVDPDDVFADLVD